MGELRTGDRASAWSLVSQFLHLNPAEVDDGVERSVLTTACCTPYPGRPGPKEVLCPAWYLPSPSPRDRLSIPALRSYLECVSRRSREER